MRILLPTGFWIYKTYHSLAKRIKEVYPEAVFGVYGSEESSKFIKEYDDIDYEIFEIEMGVKKDSFEEDIDYEELKKFEESLPCKSLWREIARDRGLGGAYNHGAIRSKNRHESDYKYILKTFNYILNQSRDIFNRFNPDLYVEGVAMGSINAIIFKQICNERNIPYIVPSLTRVKSYFAFSDCLQLLLPQIDKSYLELMKEYNENEARFMEAEGLYDIIMNELENPDYFDRINSRFNIVKHDTPIRKTKWIAGAVLGFMKVIIGAYKNPSTIPGSISYDFQRRIQGLRLTTPDFADKVDCDRKYLYYPLHANPEYSTSVQGTMWIDQVSVIEALSKSIPADWQIYVKEHPGTLVARVRPLSLYNRIRQFPNVSLVPIDMDMHKLISNAQMVAVITGTAGWEAIQRGIPSITFADNTWDILGLSKRCDNIETLSKDIYDEVRRVKQITLSERRKRIVCYLAAVLQHSFNMTYPNQFVFTDFGTDEEYEVCGKELADGLIKHLEYLQKEKGYSFGLAV